MAETNAGINAVANHLVGEFVDTMAIGTGDTAPTATDDGLENEVFRATTGDGPLNWIKSENEPDKPTEPGLYYAKLTTVGGDEIPAGTRVTEAMLVISSLDVCYSRDAFGVKEATAGEGITTTMPIYGPV